MAEGNRLCICAVGKLYQAECRQNQGLRKAETNRVTLARSLLRVLGSRINAERKERLPLDKDS
jgi:hypothetical protein